MRKSNYYSKDHLLLFKVLFLIIFFSVSCTKEYMEPEVKTDTQDNMQLKSLTIKKGTVNLEGFTRFAFTATKDGIVITDGYTMNFLACEAELTICDNKTFILNTIESFILPDGALMPMREMSFEGKITQGGRLIFTWPETWFEMGEPNTGLLQQFSEHTGCILHGPGVNKNTLNFKGFFDGEKLFAEVNLTAFQEFPGTIPFFMEVYEGPIDVKIMIDLEISN